MYEHKYTKDILTVEEASDLLKVTPATIRRLARQGNLIGRKIGKGWRFSLPTLVDWLEHKPKIETTTEEGVVDNKCRISFTNEKTQKTGRSSSRSVEKQYEDLLAPRSRH